MIAHLKNEIMRRWPELTGGLPRPSSLSFLQISGTEWEGGKVHFAFLDGRGVPLLFAKTVRKPGAEHVLEEEFRVLEELCADEEVAKHLPRPRYLGRARGRLFLVEEAVAGTGMVERMPKGRRGGRRFYPDHIERAKHFLIVLARATGRPLSGGELEDLLVGPLAGLSRRAGGEAAEIARLKDELLAAWSGGPETVAAHGDFTPKNLLLRADGSCGVIDWESARLRGLPLTDFLYFLSRYAQLGGFSRRRGEGERIRDLYQSGRPCARRAREAVEDYCRRLGYPLGIIAPLFRFHFLYRAWIKETMAGIEVAETGFWLDLFRHYMRETKAPWGLGKSN